MNADRLPSLRSDDVEDDQTRKVLGWLERKGRDVHMAHLFANAPNVFPSYISMSDALLNRASLPARLRELCILRLARRLDAEYEWWEHRRMSQADGVTLAELDAIEAGDLDGASFGPAEQLVFRITDEWVDTSWQLSDATWQMAQQELGDAALLDLVFTMAWWGAWVPSLVRALKIEVPRPAGDG